MSEQLLSVEKLDIRKRISLGKVISHHFHWSTAKFNPASKAMDKLLQSPQVHGCNGEIPLTSEEPLLLAGCGLLLDFALRLGDFPQLDPASEDSNCTWRCLLDLEAWMTQKKLNLLWVTWQTSRDQSMNLVKGRERTEGERGREDSH